MLQKCTSNTETIASLQKFYSLLYFSLDDYSDLLNFINSLNDSEATTLINLWKFFNVLREFYKISAKDGFIQAEHRLSALLDYYIRYEKIQCTGIIYPFNASESLKCLVFKETKILSSSSYPIMFKLICESYECKLILYKYGTNLTNDLLVLNTIEYISTLFSIEINTYCVIPLSPVDGLVELVENCEIDIFRNVLSNPQNQKNFVRSLSFYLSLSYVFGIGDRHIDNIILQKDGNVVYIDFSNLLGSDPKVYSDFSIPPKLKMLINQLQLENRLVDGICDYLNKMRLSYGQITNFIEMEMADPRYNISYKDIDNYMKKFLMLDIKNSQFNRIIRSKFIDCFDSYVGNFTSLFNRVACLLRK